jgi:hypothetical protein
MVVLTDNLYFSGTINTKNVVHNKIGISALRERCSSQIYISHDERKLIERELYTTGAALYAAYPIKNTLLLIFYTAAQMLISHLSTARVKYTQNIYSPTLSN